MMYKLISAAPPPTLSDGQGHPQLVCEDGQGREGKQGKPTLKVQRLLDRLHTCADIGIRRQILCAPQEDPACVNFYLTQVRLLPCLITYSYLVRVCTRYSDLSMLSHVFVKVFAGICQLGACICRPLPNQTKLKIDQELVPNY